MNELIKIEEVAEHLNKSELQYGFDIEKYFSSRDLKESRIVVAFGESDDLMEFRGAIYSELGAYGGGTAYIDSSGLIENKCDCDDCPYFEKAKTEGAKLEAIYCDEESGYTWSFKTDIPHKTFEVHDEGEKFCMGIVFHLGDLGTGNFNGGE